ncbi:trypsin-like peptidase domain-containing protein [Verrucomicrobiota bacterium]
MKKQQVHSISLRVTLLIICLSCVTLNSCSLPGGNASRLSAMDFRKVVRESKDKVFPAVVYVKCLRESHERGKKQSQEISGSGVLINSDGELLTNWHVVDKTTEIRCLLHDGRAFYAEIIGADKDMDLALLRLKSSEGIKNLPYAELGDSSKLNEGDFVMAMGAPWGMARSVSIGIVSCTRRFLQGNSEYSLWLQTDAAICPGNSGGPLINTDGKVVGINTRATFYGGDTGFAVPSKTIKEILPRLRQSGDVEWSWIGLKIQAIRDFNRNVYFDSDGKNGVIVAGTDPGSPAKRAGILERDRILSINGKPVNSLTEETLPEIRRIIGLLPIGESAAFELLRAGKKITLNLIPRKKGKVEGKELDCPRWDLTVKAINQFDNPNLYFHRKEGVFIFGVKYPGNASNARITNNGIILEIDGEKVTTLDDIKRIHKRTIENVIAKPRILFKILQNGMMQQVVLDLSRDYERE